MKYAYSFLLCSTLFSCCSINASETENLIDRIHQDINKRFAEFDKNRRNTVTRQQFLSELEPIIECVQQYSGQLTDNELEELSKKNALFYQAVDYCGECIYNDMHSVDSSTLDNIDSLIRPHSIFNTLRVDILLYVSEKARQKIDHQYTMTLQNASVISCFEVVHQLYLAATVSEDNVVKIWNLRKNACLDTFERNVAVKSIAFSNSGSCFATLEGSNIVLWNMGCKSVEKETITSESWLSSVSYLNRPQNFLHHSSVGYQDYVHSDTLSATGAYCGEEYGQLLWTIKGREVAFLGSQSLLCNRKSALIRWKKDKNMRMPEQISANDGKTLVVTMDQCPELYACEQAIKNTPEIESLKTIPQSKLYEQQLTEYEQALVRSAIEKKCNALALLAQQ